MGLTHAAKEGIWIQQYLADLMLTPPITMTILGDNQGALALAMNPAFHACTKHIRVCQHFIRECVKAGDIDLEYVSTDNQVVDVLMKGLPIAKHGPFSHTLGLFKVEVSDH